MTHSIKSLKIEIIKAFIITLLLSTSQPLHLYSKTSNNQDIGKTRLPKKLKPAKKHLYLSAGYGFLTTIPPSTKVLPDFSQFGISSILGSIGTKDIRIDTGTDIDGQIFNIDNSTYRSWIDSTKGRTYRLSICTYFRTPSITGNSIIQASFALGVGVSCFLVAKKILVLQQLQICEFDAYQVYLKPVLFLSLLTARMPNTRHFLDVRLYTYFGSSSSYIINKDFNLNWRLLEFTGQAPSGSFFAQNFLGLSVTLQFSVI